jgi:hypothetical protein
MKGSVLAAGIGIGIGMAGVIGSLLADPRQPQLLLAIGVSTLFLLASSWLATAHWLPEVSWRERTLTSGVMLLQVPLALMFGSDLMAVLPLPLALLFGAYFAYRRDSLDSMI